MPAVAAGLAAMPPPDLAKGEDRNIVIWD